MNYTLQPCADDLAPLRYKIIWKNSANREKLPPARWVPLQQLYMSHVQE